jgi:predicted dehydrogenase
MVKKIARPSRWAMIGGGRLSQVGYKRRTGALRDNTAFKLVAGAFDIDAEKGKEFGVNLGVDENGYFASRVFGHRFCRS